MYVAMISTRHMDENVINVVLNNRVYWIVIRITFTFFDPLGLQLFSATQTMFIWPVSKFIPNETVFCHEVFFFWEQLKLLSTHFVFFLEAPRFSRISLVSPSFILVDSALAFSFHFGIFRCEIYIYILMVMYYSMKRIDVRSVDE